MRRTVTLIVLTCLSLGLVFLLPDCGCRLSAGGEGDKALDVSMGGKVTTTDRLDFQAVSYSGQRLEITNTATEHDLAIGVGTPILAGNGTEAARIANSATLGPGQTATFTLSAPLQIGQTYYLGAPQSGSKPNIRQLFICPGESSGSGGGGYDIPVPQDPNVDDLPLP